MDFGQRLAQARKNKELTQEKLAEELNLSRQTISRWEQNQVFPDIVNLRAVTETLNVSFNDLLEENPNPHLETGVSLLVKMIGRKIKIHFLTDYENNYMNIYNKTIQVLDCQDDIIQIQYEENEKKHMQIIPLAHILSFTLEEEG